MKKLPFLIIIFLMINSMAFAQIPNTFKYQTIVRDASGYTMVNQNVSFQISILQGSASGTNVYTETHTATTNEFGLINLNIGEGTTTDNFSTINWANGPYFLKIELDETGGNTYALMGTSQLLSVPYAMYAKDVENNEDADADATNELISSAILSGTNLEISDAGGTTVIDLSSLDQSGMSVDDADADPTNEFQIINFSNDTLYLDNGGQVFLGSYTNLWQQNDTNIYYNNGWVGVGTSTPSGMMVVQGDDGVDPDSALFEVKNKNGQTIFAVYDGGVRIWVDDSPLKASTDKGGFAVAGYRVNKVTTNEYLRVTPDSVRVYVREDDGTKASTDKGGFAVAGYRVNKSVTNEYFNINPTLQADTLNPSEARIFWYPLKEAFLSGRVLVESVDSVGLNSWASGYESKSIGDYSQALGYRARAKGNNSTAIGYYANAITDNSYAIGDSAVAKGLGSFALGSIGRDSSGNPTGFSTVADGEYAMAIGMGAHSSGKSSLSAGSNCLASGDYAIAFGYADTASGNYSSAFGRNAVAVGEYSFAAGYDSRSNGSSSYSFGRNALASGDYSYALGYYAHATSYSYALGGSATADDYAIAFGLLTKALGNSSVAIGRSSEANAINATAIGREATSSGENAFALGYLSSAGGDFSYALGKDANASALGAYALGYNATASNLYATAIGRSSQASANYSFAIGYQANSSADYAIAIGSDAIANGLDAIAIGSGADATSNGVAIGYYTDAGSGSLGTAIGANSKATGANSISIGGGIASGDGAKTIGLITASGYYSFGIALSNLLSTNVTQANTMAIMGGRLGVGTVSPNSILHINALTGDNPFRVQVASNTKFKVTTDGNVAIGNPTMTGTRVLAIVDGTAPTGPIANGVLLYADNINVELKTMDELGNITTLSPHNFSLTNKSEPMAWSFYSENQFIGYKINVDMLKAIRLIENLSGEQLVFMQELETNNTIEPKKSNQSLVEKVEKQQKTIDKLKTENDLLKARLDKIEKMLSK